MTKKLFGLALAAAWMGATTVWADAPAPPIPAVPAIPTAAPTLLDATPRHHGNQVQGHVTAVDAAKQTVTVTTRRSPTGTLVTLAPNAKILVTQPAAIGDVKTGTLIEAYGDVTPGATTITADRLVIVPAAPPQGKPGPHAGYHRNRVQGTVAGTTPTLTMTTAGGVNVTVTTTAATAVTKVLPGTFADLIVGANVQARTSGDAASPTTTEIRVLPTSAARQGHHRKTAAVAIDAPVSDATPVK